MPKAELTPRAEADMRDIWRYTAETWSEQQAQRYSDDLFDMMEALALAPQRGRPADDLSLGLRKQNCGAHTIFYRPSETGALIVRVLHQRMDHAAKLANDEG